MLLTTQFMNKENMMHKHGHLVRKQNDFVMKMYPISQANVPNTYKLI